MIKSLLFCLLLASTLSAQSQCPNLLQNPGAEEGLTGWDFTTGEYSGWEIPEDSDGNHTFVSSSFSYVDTSLWSIKSQVIDLTASYSTFYLDSEPEIYVQEMYKGHATTDNDDHYSDKYYFNVKLKDASGNVLASFNDGSQANPLTTSKSWQTSSHTFSSYGSGLRSIHIESGGHDAEYWNGYYGAKMDEAEVRFVADGTSDCQNISIFENNKASLTEIYPNPSSGPVTIDLGNNYENITVTLKSISGQVISEQLYESAKSLNLEIDQPSGLYVIETKIGSNKNSSLLKIVK